MSLRLALACAAALGSVAVAEPRGADAPLAGAPLLAEVFPGALPFPFEALLGRLRELAGPGNVETALIPLGRSLQRYAADPDYFASPRVVVAVTGDRAAGPGSLRLADRIFLGYQPAADAIEAISWNEAAGRFEFQEVVGYSEGALPEPAERRVCLVCHQGAGPIFARPLWSETNADPAIAARLAPLGESFHGAPVRQTVDAMERLDAATDRANRLPLAARLWEEGCRDAGCRAGLLAAALRAGLGAGAGAAPAGFVGPEVAIPSPDLPNRDPLIEPGGALETTGRFDPETPREPVTLWPPAEGFPAAASAVAAVFSAGDLAWVDGLLRRRPGPSETLKLPCVTTEARLPTGATEARFACASAGARLAGFRGPDGAGRLDSLALAGQPAVAVPLPLTGRAPDGRRLSVALTDAEATVTLTDDLAGLDAALAGAGLPDGPLRREDVLALLAALLGGTDG